MPDKKFEEFIERVRATVDGKAASKGYNETGTEGDNPLFDFTERFFPGHAGGEIVYKLVRYVTLKNPEDLEKAAGWAYLVWKQHRERESK
jgi:hypothetical protein